MVINPTIGGVNQNAETVFAPGGSAPVAKIKVPSTGATVANAIAPLAASALTSFFDSRDKNRLGKGFMAIESELIKNQHLSNPERRKLVHDTVKGLDFLSDSQRGTLIQQVKERQYKSKTLSDGRVAQVDAGGAVVGIDGEPDVNNSVSGALGQIKNQLQFAEKNSPGASEALATVLKPIGADVSQAKKEEITGVSLELSEALNNITGTFNKANRGVMGGVNLRNIDDIEAHYTKNAGKLVGNIEIFSSMLRSPKFINNMLAEGKAFNSTEVIMNAAKVDTLKRMQNDPDAVRNMGPNGSFEKVAAIFDAEIAEHRLFATTVLKNSPAGVQEAKLALRNNIYETQRSIVAQARLIGLRENHPALYKQVVDMDAGIAEAHFKAATVMVTTGNNKTAKDYYKTYLDPIQLEHARTDVTTLEGWAKSTTGKLGPVAATLQRLKENGAVTRDRSTVDRIAEAFQGEGGILSRLAGNDQADDVRTMYNAWIKSIKEVHKIYDAAGVK